MNGALVAVGPGRSEASVSSNASCFDAINILDVATQACVGHGCRLSIGIQGFHSDLKTASVQLFVRLFRQNGQVYEIGTQPSWKGLDATAYFNPSESTASAYSQPVENILARYDTPGSKRLEKKYFTPVGWLEASYDDSTWEQSIPSQLASIIPSPKSHLPIEVTTGIVPKLTKITNTTWFVDFETEIMAGICLEVEVCSHQTNFHV